MSQKTGVLQGVRVLDLSWGISGPVAAMLLSDHGADVTKIDPPGGDPFRSLSGYRVWQRGKRSAVLDLADTADRDRFVALASEADVVLESFGPGTAARLGVDYATLSAANPRLIHCSITAYGDLPGHADRPGYEALVGARTGHQFESRGTVGGTIARLSGSEPMNPGLEAPDDCWVGAPRQGPLFSGVPWIALATAYLADLGISAALRARELTGRGQHVHTSLLQGVLSTTAAPWQRVERPDTANFQTWVIDPRAPKGFYRASDGRWLHHWVPLPGFILGVSEGDHIQTEGIEAPRKSQVRITMAPEDMHLLHAWNAEFATRVAKYPSQDWVDAAAEIGCPVQPVRSPEEALLDPLLLADGCVIEVDDPEVGPIRQVGRVYSLEKCPTQPPAPAAALGAHTDEVRAEADAIVARAAEVPEAPAGGRALQHPLEGITVLDLGLAVAGPWGTQLLGDLGANVIKVNTKFDWYWMSNHIAMLCNRSKRSIGLDLKTPEGMAILHELVAKADIVQHNMRYDAAVRLGVDYESLRAIKPDLIYCHTKGFEDGPRQLLPGNDQTGAALAGTEWLDGGLDDGGHPLWGITSLGDTGNGYLSAIAMIQALLHRDRTGEGQFVSTSIMYAQLLNASTAWVTPDGATAGARQQLDANQTGWSPTYRLYECAGGRWVCIAALTDGARSALAGAIGADALPSDGEALVGLLREWFAARTAAHAFAALDGAGVPCEIADEDFSLRFFDDPEVWRRGWLTSYEHPTVGKMDMFGLLVDLSETPGVVQGPPIRPGEHTREILRELGYDDVDVDALVDKKIAVLPR